MLYNFKKMTQQEVLTGIYGSETFRNKFYKWTRIGSLPMHKLNARNIVVDYEHFVINNYESHWFYGRLLSKFDYCDLPMFVHNRLIARYTA